MRVDALKDIETDYSLRSYTRTSRQSVQSHSLAEQYLVDRTSNGGAVFDGLEGFTFLDVPLDAG